MATITTRLLRKVVCPHCWKAFSPEEVLWISAHAELLGDPRLGSEQQQRFLPTRFNLDGNALDARGFPCHDLACPQCHLLVPRANLEMESCFLSILGTPASGKSYFLASTTWEMRRLLPAEFALSFADVDTVANRSLNEYEETIFLNPTPTQLVPLADLVRKTELQGELYDTVLYGQQTITYPRPFLFAVQPLEQHPRYAERDRLSRVLCLYDNAGEHFLAGQDSTSAPVTRHLAQSRLLLYLFDPTQDLRFRQKMAELGSAGQAMLIGRQARQEAVLLEAATRVRRFAGLGQHEKHKRPLLVLVKAKSTSLVKAAGTLNESSIISAAALMEMAFSAQPWAVKDLLPGGVSVLAGCPKAGKSWLALQVAVEVSLGIPALGSIKTNHGRVLYLGLEDSHWRLKSRLQHHLASQVLRARAKLDLSTDPLDATPTAIGGWAARHRDTRLVIVDTLACVRSGRGRLNGSYTQQYDLIGGFKRVADQHGLTILLVHHLRKAKAQNPLEQVMGSVGLTGSADAVLVLERKEGTVDAVLRCTGRDITTQDLSLQFCSGCKHWGHIAS